MSKKTGSKVDWVLVPRNSESSVWTTAPITCAHHSISENSGMMKHEDANVAIPNSLTLLLLSLMPVKEMLHSLVSDRWKPSLAKKKNHFDPMPLWNHHKRKNLMPLKYMNWISAGMKENPRYLSQVLVLKRCLQLPFSTLERSCLCNER